MKLSLIYFVPIILHVHFVFGQNVIKGRVCNNQNEPIPYTSIYDIIGGRGTYSNINGYFNMPYEKLPLKLIFSNVGYETKTVWVAKQEEVKITLEEKNFHLKEVVIYSGEKPIKYVGSHKKKKGNTNYFVSYPYEQLGIVVNNQNNALYRDPKWLSFSMKVSPGYVLGYQVGNKPMGEPQLRLRLYEMGQNNMPGADILHEDIILSPEKKGWYKVDLNSKYIQVPQEGFVMAVEWLENSSIYRHKVKSHGGKDHWSQEYGISVVSYDLSDEEKEMYSFIKYEQREWKRIEHWQMVIPRFRLEFVELEE